MRERSRIFSTILLITGSFFHGVGVDAHVEGAVVNIPEIPGASITFDGTENDAEWAGAASFSIDYNNSGTHPLTAEVKAFYKSDGIYLLIVTSDATKIGNSDSDKTDNDWVRVYFDINHSGGAAATSTDWGIAILRNGQATWGSADLTPPWSTEVLEANLGVTSNSTWTIEVRLPADDPSGLDVSTDTVGIYFCLYNEALATQSASKKFTHWPEPTDWNVTPPLTPDDWGNFILTKPDIMLSTDSLDFGELTFGGMKDMSVDIENIGTADLDVTEVSLADGTEFMFYNSFTGGIIQPGAKETVTVRYAPTSCTLTAAESHEATLTVKSNDPDTPSLVIDMSGKAPCPDIELTEPFLNFGKLPLGDIKDMTVTIENNGVEGSKLNVEVRVEKLDSSTDDYLPFSLGAIGEMSQSFLVENGGSAEVTVRYNPTEGSTLDTLHQAQLIFESNDPDDEEAEQSIIVEGNAREFVDTIFILDRSGSMLDKDKTGTTKWKTTEWATAIAAEVLRLFRLEGDTDGDRVGAVWFGGSTADFFDPLTRFTGGDPTSFTSSFVDPEAHYMTPIGVGIERAHEGFEEEEEEPTRTNVGILMSDGLHNWPTEATTVEGLGLEDPVKDNEKMMQIHTIALGIDTNVSTDLLNAIRDHYEPPGSGSTFNITSNPEKLGELFTESLMEPLLVNRIAFDVRGGDHLIM